jgi:hypothetical protein
MTADNAVVLLTLQAETGPIECIQVRVTRRRALEVLAFYQAHQQLQPDEPFMVSIQGRLRETRKQAILLADTITFHVSPDVKRAGGRLAYTAFAKYARAYGHQAWLEGAAQDRNK